MYTGSGLYRIMPLIICLIEFVFPNTILKIEYLKLRNSYEGRDLYSIYLVIQFLPHRKHSASPL